MLVIRTLHFLKYDPYKRRFQSDSFRPNGNGISVFSEDCAIAVENSGVCNHIQEFYGNTVGNPSAFWKIDADDLISYYNKDGIIVTVEPTDGGNGDNCHFDIFGLPKKLGKPYFLKRCDIPSIFFCHQGAPRNIVEADYPLLAEFYKREFDELKKA